jgi:hypothetical protein
MAADDSLSAASLFVAGIQTLAKAGLLRELEAILCRHSQDSHPSPDFVTLPFRT